jgi:hypothetical protein
MAAASLASSDNLLTGRRPKAKAYNVYSLLHETDLRLMNKASALGTVAVGLHAATVGLAGPARADTWEPTPPTVPFAGSSPASDDAGTVVSNLTSAGYRVMLDNIGNEP